MSTYAPDPECVFCQDNPRIVWEGGGLKVCSDPAPLAAGHLLIYATEHYPSAADLTIDLVTRMDNIERALGEAMVEKYGDYALFEHGRTGHCIRSRPGERLCHHVHVHLIPCAVPPLEELIPLTQRRAVASWSEVVELGAETDGYVVIGGNGRPKQFLPVSHDLEPHYLRTVIATALNHPERADWEQFQLLPGAQADSADSHRDVEQLVNHLTVAS